MIAITTRSSIKVKPRLEFDFERGRLSSLSIQLGAGRTAPRQRLECVRFIAAFAWAHEPISVQHCSPRSKRFAAVNTLGT